MVSQFEFQAVTSGGMTGLDKGKMSLMKMSNVDANSLEIEENPSSQPWMGDFANRLNDDNDEILSDIANDRRAESIAEYSDDALSCVVRGAIRIQLGDLLGGVADYDRAIELEPEFAIAYNSRGSVRLQLLQDEDAIADYNRAIELDASNPEFYANRGMAYSLIGQIPRAIADFKQAISLYQFHNDRSNTRKLEKFVENLCQQYRL